MKKVFWILLTCFALGAHAQNDAADTSADEGMTAEEFMASLKPQTGQIQLPGGIASLNLSTKFQYLSPESAERLLVDGWGNPPGNETLGMIIPADISPLEAEGWGVVITYDEDGHVKDSDADEIDYQDLLKDMKEESAEANKERVKAGYGSMELVGWAESPRYDKATHKFYWAKEYQTDRGQEHSLNYNIRVLGRKGVLVLNAIAGMSQLDTIKMETPDLLAMTEFTKGNRYEDFNSSTDHVAEYGLAALVAGGVAAKMGLFAKLFAMLIVLKKFIIIGLVAVGSFVMKLLGKKSS